MLRVDTKTWTRDSHDLYDYEAQQVNRRSFLISASVSFFRNRAHVTCVEDKVDELPTNRQDLLFSIITYEKGGKREYVIAPANGSFSETYNVKKLWIIVKELHPGYHLLQMDDIIKLGRFRLKVRHLSLDLEDFKFAKLSDNDPMEMQDIPLRDCVQCRICLTEGDSEDDPLICPCECKGSIKYAHFLCLQKWVCGRTDMEQEARTGAVFIRDMCCELCKAEFPRSIKKNNRVMHFIKIPSSLFPVVILDSLSYSNVRGLHILSFANKTQLKIGRGHECDLRIPDVSISRLHATIRFVDGEFRLEDQGSKFGTLIAIRRAIILSDGTPFIFQVGRSIIELEVNLREPFRSGVIEIIEDMQVLDTPQANNELQDVIDDDPEGTTQTNRVTRNQRISSNVNVPNETVDSDDVILLEERVVSPPGEAREQVDRRDRRGRNNRTNQVNRVTQPPNDFLFHFASGEPAHRVEIVELDIESSEENEAEDEEIIRNISRFVARRNDRNDRNGNGNVSRRNTNTGNGNESRNRNRNDSQHENSNRSRNRNRNTSNTENHDGNSEVIVLDSDTNEATNTPTNNMRGEFRFRSLLNMITAFPYRSRNATRMEPPSGNMQTHNISNSRVDRSRENNSRTDDTHGDRHESNENNIPRTDRNLLCLPDRQRTQATGDMLQRDFVNTFRTVINPIVTTVANPTSEGERRNREIPTPNNPQPPAPTTAERTEGNRVERPRRRRRRRTLLETVRNRAMELAERQFNTMRNDSLNDFMFGYMESHRRTTTQPTTVDTDRNNTAAGTERTGTRRTTHRSGRNSRTTAQRNTQRNSRRNTQTNVQRNTQRTTRRSTQGTNERTMDGIMERDIRRNIEMNVLSSNNRTNTLGNNERNTQRNEGTDMNNDGRNPMERRTSIIVPERNDWGVLRIIREERHFTLDLGNTSQTRENEEVISVEGESQERERENQESVKDLQVTRDDSGETISETDQRRNRNALDGTRDRQQERNEVENEGTNERDTPKEEEEEDSEEESEGDSEVIVVRDRKDDDDEQNNDGTGTNNAEGNRRTSIEGRRESGIMSGRRNRENTDHTRNHQTSRTPRENNQSNEDRCNCVFCSDKNLERATYSLLNDLRNTVNLSVAKSAEALKTFENPVRVFNACMQIQNGNMSPESGRALFNNIPNTIEKDLQIIRELSEVPRDFLKRKITEIQRLAHHATLNNKEDTIETEPNESKRPKMNGKNERNNNREIPPSTETNRTVDRQGEFASFLLKKSLKTLEEQLKNNEETALKQMVDVLHIFKNIVENFTKQNTMSRTMDSYPVYEVRQCVDCKCIISNKREISLKNRNDATNKKTETNEGKNQGGMTQTVNSSNRKTKTKAEMVHELFSDLIVAVNADRKGLHEHVQNMKKRMEEDGLDYNTPTSQESKNKQNVEGKSTVENYEDEMIYRENDLYASDDDSFSSVRSREIEANNAQGQNRQNKNKKQNVLQNVRDTAITAENTPIKKNSNITDTNTETNM